MTALTIIYCGVLGLMVGSFLNVVIYRVPRGESIVRPRSACPSCGAPIAGRDNIPVVSWLLLRGHCRQCAAPISGRYPLVEAGCGALFAGVAARAGDHWDLPAFLVAFAGLFALACIDAEKMVLPKRVLYPTFGLTAALFVLAAAEAGTWHRLLVAAICGVAWAAAFFVLNFASPRLLGFGD